MERTQHQVLRILQRSGRNQLTMRQLAVLRHKGLLPPLTRKTMVRSNTPIYVWTQPDIVKQAAVLHDLLIELHHHQFLSLPLWYLGYTVPLEQARQMLLTPIEQFLEPMTSNCTDSEDVLDAISRFLLDELFPRWKYSPHPPSIVRRYGFQTATLLAECGLDLFWVPEYLPDHELLTDLLTAFRQTHPGVVIEGEDDVQLPSLIQELLLPLQRTFSLPRLHQAILQATPEQWDLARRDAHQLCALLLPLRIKHPPSVRACITVGGLLFLPLLLSIHVHSSPQWISSLYTFLNDPNLREILAALQRLIDNRAGGKG